ncbi:MAG: N-acetylmuramoyl-L-alanine amidase [Elusimicrobiota bacterium]
MRHNVRAHSGAPLQFLWTLCLLPSLAVSAVIPSTPTITPATLTIVHPTEGQRLPLLSQIFAFGAVVPGSTLTINGSTINVHSSGGYLAMVPVSTGDFVLSAEVKSPAGDSAKLDRRIYVAPGFIASPLSPLTIEKGSVSPFDDAWLMAGDSVRVSFQGSSGASAEFSIEGVARKIPMMEVGVSSAGRRGIYEGLYTIQPEDKVHRASIEVTLKRRRITEKEKAAGRLTIDNTPAPRVGLLLEDVAARTGPDGGYDLFLAKGMRVRLTGKVGGQWRVRLSAMQSGWVRENAVQELPPGTQPAQSPLGNFIVTRQDENTLIRVPLGDVLPYRAEQNLNPAQLVVTLYGAVAKTDLIRYDPFDTLIQQVRWRQTAPDTVQLVIEPAFQKWWGYDIRYEGTTLLIEIRKPWLKDGLAGMAIAVDAGHGGSDSGAIGPHGTLEKDANLAIANVVRDALARAGANPFLIRETDSDIPLYDRPRIAWKGGARLFISIHCNAAGNSENPVWNNGFSIYWYHPQSLTLAKVIHSDYRKRLPLPDHGLFYADFAVCRMTQMPSFLAEQAFIIVPEQEQMIFDPKFQKQVAASIVNGIKAFLAKP